LLRTTEVAERSINRFLLIRTQSKRHGKTTILETGPHYAMKASERRDRLC